MFSLSNYEMEYVEHGVDIIVDILNSRILDFNKCAECPMSIYFAYEGYLFGEAYDGKMFPFICCLYVYEKILKEITEENKDEDILHPQIIVKNPSNMDNDFSLIVEDYRYMEEVVFSIRLNEKELRNFLNFMMERDVIPYDCMINNIRKKPRNKSARK